MWQNLSESEKIKWTADNDEMEIKSVEEGVARYRRALEHMELTPSGRMAVLSMIEKVAAAILRDQQDMLDGMACAGRPATWAQAYVTMCNEKLALIVLSKMVEADESSKLALMASRIADRVKLEHELEEIQRINKLRSKEDKGFSRNFIDRLRGDSEKIRKLFKKMNGKAMRWTPTQRMGLGSRLCMVVCKAGVGFNIVLARDKKKTIYFVEREEALQTLLDQWESSDEIRMPSLHPMSCPPTPWTQDGATIKGGYRFSSLEAIKYYGIAAHHRPDLKDYDISYVLGAVNAIQSVEWRIDEDTLAFAKKVLSSNNSRWNSLIPSVPDKVILDKISKGSSKEEIKVWRQKKDALMSARNAAVGQRIAAQFAITEAIRFVGKPVFFVHCLDWRGRIYPAPTALHPQGTDLCKALLKYSEGLKLGPNGLDRLKQWAASCAGVDKVSLSDRIKWWNETWGDRPDVDNDLRWVEYDDPFLFAQAARDIAAAMKSGNPREYVSHISICVDGSQNGLQHLSAIGRDEIGGEAVNLVDAEVPNDLYADVAAYVYSAVCGDVDMATETGKIKDDCNQDVPPIAWLTTLKDPKKRRKVVKRSVLAYPYGVTKPGMRDGLIADGFTDGIEGSKHRNAWYLAEKIDSSVRDVVVSAARLMDWLRTCAEATARSGHPVFWVTPSGFPCKMRYLVQEDKRIEVNGIKLTIKSDTEVIDTAAQVRGIVANFIHSLDASHLVLTCHAMIKAGVGSFQFIHDSYGCHAGRIDMLAHYLRREFVDMHTEDMAAGIYDWMAESCPDIPFPPNKGNLNIDNIMDSRFFFS